MKHLALRRTMLIAALFSFPVFVAAHAQPLGPEQGPLRRQEWNVPLVVTLPPINVMMKTTVFRPPGEGPFPLVVINHGTTESAEQRAKLPRPDFDAMAAWLVARGYVVAVPQRPGHGATGGPYLESQKSCVAADFYRAGLGTAAAIEATIRYMTTQPFVLRTGVIVIGHSAGGWGVLALASRDNLRQLVAGINFAGGRGGRVHNMPGQNCAPDRLIDTARRYGDSARIPTLWIYSRNDSYFAPDLVQRMYDAFRLAGGRAELHMLPAFGNDGHFLALDANAVPLWAPFVERFLARFR